MTTRIRKPVERLDERNAIVVILAPEGIYTREKGRRTVYGPRSYLALHQYCAGVQAARRIHDRLTQRNAR